MNRKLISVLALAVAVYLGMIAYAGWDDLQAVFADYGFSFFALAIVLASGNFFLRYLRWEWLLRRTGIRLPVRDSLLISLGGLALTITPGKVGEVFKSYLLQQRGVPVARSLPIIFVERLTDLISVILLALTGVMAYRSGLLVFAVSAGLTLALVMAARSSRAVERLPGILARIPRLKKRRAWFAELLATVRQLLDPTALLVTISLGVAAWFLEALALFCIVMGAHQYIDLFAVNFVYCLSTLAGVFFPGGIGGTEGSMAVLLVKSGLASAVALSVVLLVRAATLWWATLVGVVALAVLSRGKVGRVLQELDQDRTPITGNPDHNTVSSPGQIGQPLRSRQDPSRE